MMPYAGYLPLVPPVRPPPPSSPLFDLWGSVFKNSISGLCALWSLAGLAQWEMLFGFWQPLPPCSAPLGLEVIIVPQRYEPWIFQHSVLFSLNLDHTFVTSFTTPQLPSLNMLQYIYSLDGGGTKTAEHE